MKHDCFQMVQIELYLSVDLEYTIVWSESTLFAQIHEIIIQYAISWENQLFCAYVKAVDAFKLPCGNSAENCSSHDMTHI